jgi:sugar diacid utilization regulator
VTLSQVLRNLLATVPNLESDILLRVWGDGYDEQHVDPTELSSKISFNVPWLLRSLDPSANPDDGEALAIAGEIGRRRAIQGVSVDAVIRSWRTAEQVIEERLIERAAEIETAELLGAIRRLGRLVAELTDRSVESYRTVEQEATGHYDRLATDLVAQIVSGAYLSSEEVVRRARVVQADASAAYTAVAIGIPEREDPATHLLVQRHLLSHLGLRSRSRILVGSLEDRPLFLVPATPDGVAHQLGRALAAEVVPEGFVLGVSAASAPLGEAYEIAQQARLAVEVAQRTSRRTGVVRYRQVAVDTLLLREPATADLLSELLAPLVARPELLDTMRAYFANGFSARATARALYVHPNTVPHRLRTIERVLGRTIRDASSCVDIILALRWLDLRRGGDEH